MEAFSADEDLDEARKILKDLKQMILYKHELEDGNFVKKGSTRRINMFIQDMFRNLKMYDYIINFLTANHDLLLRIRLQEADEDTETESKVRNLFKRCFNLMKNFTQRNKTNQNLMWKYKEYFTYPELGSTEDDYELEFILTIVDENDYINRP